MKSIFTFFVLSFFLIGNSFAQQAPDFTFTDINGEEHNLSATLAEGKVVLLDFFFVNCGPCNTWGPEIDQIAADFEGTTLEVWAISDRDSDAYISGSIFNPTHENHFVGGSAGGGAGIVNLYAANFAFSGFPTYAVICTDGSITWDIWPLTPGVSQIRNQLTEECGVVELNASSVSEIETLAGSVIYPNPASETAILQFDLTSNTNIEVSIFNTLGQRVSNLPSTRYVPGMNTVNLDVANFSQGVYFVRMQSEKGTNSMQLTIE